MSALSAELPGSALVDVPRRGMQIKTYIVFLPNNVAREGEANRSVLAVKLTRESARRVRDRYPGAYIERHVADKL